MPLFNKIGVVLLHLFSIGLIIWIKKKIFIIALFNPLFSLQDKGKLEYHYNKIMRVCQMKKQKYFIFYDILMLFHLFFL